MSGPRGNRASRRATGSVRPRVKVWLDEFQDGPAPLVILDTLGKVMPQTMPGESAYQRDYRIGSDLKALVDAVPGAALVVAHHDRKAEASDFVQRVSGTNGLAGAADTIAVVARARSEAQGRINVTGRDVEENEYACGVVPHVNALATGIRDAGGTVAWVVPGPSRRTAVDREFYGDEVAAAYAASGGSGPLPDRR